MTHRDVYECNHCGHGFDPERVYEVVLPDGVSADGVKVDVHVCMDCADRVQHYLAQFGVRTAIARAEENSLFAGRFFVVDPHQEARVALYKACEAALDVGRTDPLPETVKLQLLDAMNQADGFR